LNIILIEHLARERKICLHSTTGLIQIIGLVNPDPDSERQSDTNRIKNIHVLKSWMFSLEGWRLLL
jgi:hypothetical protein